MLCYALQDCLCRPQSRVISRLRKLLSGSKKELFKRWYLKAQEERAWGSHMDLLTGDAKMKSKKRAEMARKRAELIAAAGGDEEAALAALEAEMATIASLPLSSSSSAAAAMPMIGSPWGKAPADLQEEEAGPTKEERLAEEAAMRAAWKPEIVKQKELLDDWNVGELDQSVRAKLLRNLQEAQQRTGKHQIARWLDVWRRHARARRERANMISAALARMRTLTPQLRDMRVGFEAAHPQGARAVARRPGGTVHARRPRRARPGAIRLS